MAAQAESQIGAPPFNQSFALAGFAVVSVDVGRQSVRLGGGQDRRNQGMALPVELLPQHRVGGSCQAAARPGAPMARSTVGAISLCIGLTGSM